MPHTGHSWHSPPLRRSSGRAGIPTLQERCGHTLTGRRAGAVAEEPPAVSHFRGAGHAEGLGSMNGPPLPHPSLSLHVPLSSSLAPPSFVFTPPPPLQPDTTGGHRPSDAVGLGAKPPLAQRCAGGLSGWVEWVGRVSHGRRYPCRVLLARKRSYKVRQVKTNTTCARMIPSSPRTHKERERERSSALSRLSADRTRARFACSSRPEALALSISLTMVSISKDARDAKTSGRPAPVAAVRHRFLLAVVVAALFSCDWARQGAVHICRRRGGGRVGGRQRRGPMGVGVAEDNTEAQAAAAGSHQCGRTASREGASAGEDSEHPATAD